MYWLAFELPKFSCCLSIISKIPFGKGFHFPPRWLKYALLIYRMLQCSILNQYCPLSRDLFNKSAWKLQYLRLIWSKFIMEAKILSNDIAYDFIVEYCSIIQYKHNANFVWKCGENGTEEKTTKNALFSSCIHSRLVMFITLTQTVTQSSTRYSCCTHQWRKL